MKPRSIKVGDEQWKRWATAANETGIDRSTYIRQAVDAYSAPVDVPADLQEAQRQIDSLSAENAHLKRELAMRGQIPARSTLPGMGRPRYACSECGNLNVQGRCATHPAARQNVLESR